MPLQIPLLQSNMVVTIETDANITGIGEGGTRDTLEPCAGRLIGKNPFQIERLWQDMYRAFHYPPGRERLHAIGALDLALWDLKGKALGVPVYELLGGMNRNHLECYTTTFRGGGNSSATAPPRACRQAGGCSASMRRAFRRAPAATTPASACGRCRPTAAPRAKASGPSGNFMVDFHQRFTFADALRGCRLIEEFEPYLVEDPVQTDSFLQDIPKLRSLTSVPLAAGEEWGARWDFHQAGREPRPRLRSLLAAERRRHHRDDPHLRAVRDARHRHRPALHRPDRHRRADPRARTVSAVGRLRIQLRDAADRVSERVPDVQGGQALSERSARPRRDA